MKKIVKNVAASVLPQLINIISNLILPTMIIAKFGSEINGLVSTTKSIVSYISIVGAGIASAVTQALYSPMAKREYNTVKGMYNAASRMFNKYGLLYCIIAIGVAFIYPLTISTDIRYLLMVELMIVMSISAASEFFAVGKCRSLLYADQKTYVCTIIQAASLLGSLLLAIGMLRLNANIVIVQLAISATYVIRAFFLEGYVKKKYLELKDYKSVQPDYSAIAKRKDAMIHQLSGLAVNTSQPTIITMIIGLEATSIYSVYYIVFSGLQSICSNLSIAVTPFLGRELALENRNRLLKMYDWIEYAFFYMVSFVYSVAMVLIVPFVKLYTRGADINYDYPVFASVFVVSSAFYILKLPSNSLINVSGLFKETRWRAVTEGVLTVVLSIILAVFLGLSGVVLGTGMVMCWRCIDTILFTDKHILKCGNKKSLFRLCRTLVIILLFCGYQSVYKFSAANYLEWIKGGVCFSGIAVAILLVDSLIFERKTLKEIYAFVRTRKM